MCNNNYSHENMSNVHPVNNHANRDINVRLPAFKERLDMTIS